MCRLSLSIIVASLVFRHIQQLELLGSHRVPNLTGLMHKACLLAELADLAMVSYHAAMQQCGP